MDSGSGSRGRTRCLFPFPPFTLTFAHALPLNDLQWAMPVQVVSCTQSIQPRVSTMYTLDTRLPPTQPLHPHHAPRRLNNHSRTQGSPSQSSQCLLSPSSTTSSSSATPGHVSSTLKLHPHFFYSPPSLFLSLFLLFLSIHTFLHSSQGRRRRIVRNCVVVRLAWDPTPQYTAVRHAVRPGCACRVRRQATRSRQENEETMGRRLGRVQKTQRARGSFVSTTRSTILLISSPVAKKYPIPPKHNSPLRFLSPSIQQRALFRVRVYGR